MKQVKVYFDGNVLNNGKLDSKGSCSFRLEYGEHSKQKTVELADGMTNNQAEYYGLLNGLLAIKPAMRKEVDLTVTGDSKLVISQITRAWECKEPKLRKLRDCVLDELGKFHSWNAVWIPRDENKAG